MRKLFFYLSASSAQLVPYVLLKYKSIFLDQYCYYDYYQDGCFTSDSDIFLFGARTVYRDICLG